MIALYKVKISPVFFVAVVGCAALWGIQTAGEIFFSLFLHEAMHIYCIKRFGGEIEGFALLPCGAKLSLSRPVKGIGKTVILYLSAPLLNLVLAVGACCMRIFFLQSDRQLEFFIFYNILLFLINMLPIAPLDMSKILYALLQNVYRPLQSAMIMFWWSLVWSLLLLGWGLYLWIWHDIFFMLVLGGFFLYHTYKEKENAYNSYSRKAASYLGEKNKKQGYEY